MKHMPDENDNIYIDYFNSDNVIVMLIDLDTEKIIKASKGAIDFFKHPLQVLEGMSIDSLIKSPIKSLGYFKEFLKINKSLRFQLPYISDDEGLKDIEFLFVLSQSENKNLSYLIVKDITEERQKESETFKLIADNSTDLICLHDSNGDYLYISPSVERVLGYKKEELVGKSPYNLIHPDDIENIKNNVYNKLIKEKQYQRIEHRIRRKDGTYIWIETIATPNINEQGDVVSIETCSRDICKRKIVEDSIRISEEKFSKLFHMNPLPMSLTDMSNGRIIEANQAFVQKFGFEDESIIGHTTKEVDLFLDYNVRNEIVKKARIDGKVNDFEVEVKYRNGQVAIVSINLETISIGGEGYFLSVMTDITERKNNEKKAFYNANHDALTSVPNRWLLEKKLKSTIEKAKFRNELVAIMFIDLDGFKQVNDNFGHKAGDDLLKEIANRLKTVLRDEDTVARFGGDEFVVILPKIDKRESLVTIAKRINSICRVSVNMKNTNISISSSIGISLFPSDGKDIDNLVKNADVAMYRAKSKGKDNYCFYE